MSEYQAIEYIRISHADDIGKESNSVTNQKRLIEDFIAQNPDIELVGEKVDDGYSGVIFDRPAFKEMMNDIKAGKINCVIVKDLSRLGREYIETGRYLRRIFPTYGVRFIAINDNIDTLRDSGDDLAVSLKNIINDAYCRDISIKTRSALAAKRRNGDYIGACTVYGYRKSEENKNRLAIDEYAASVVQDIFRMKIEGASAAKIADELNRIGVLSPIEYKKQKGLPHPTGGYADKEGAKWSAHTVIRILKDETYTGTLIQGKQSTHNHKIKKVIDLPADKWERTEDAHDAIIRRHDFDLVQRIMHLDTRTSPDESNVYLFSGILICGCCGGHMTRKVNSNQGNRRVYYYCRTGKKNGCNHPIMVKESDVIDCVLQSVKGFIRNVVSLHELLNDMSAAQISTGLVKKYTAQIRENENQLEQIRQFKSTLYEKFVGSFISKDEYKYMKSQYTENGKRLEAAISSLRQELEAITDNTSERLKWMEHFKRFEDLEELDRKAVIHLIKSITVRGKSEYDISFTFGDEYQNALMLLAERTEQREAV